MKRAAKNAIAAGLTATAIAATLIGINSTSASAINQVTCDSTDYVRITVHIGIGQPEDVCWANGGENINFPDEGLDQEWVTKIWTGNNRVQWLGDEKWQPENSWIPPWTNFTWPNHPGGVRITGIKIV